MAGRIFKRNEIEIIAKNILAKKPNIIAMSGPLGAGKTTLTKEIARQLGVIETITSPTYVLETEHRILNTGYYFIHIDCYRMESFDELIRLGIEERIEHGDIIVIEWADKFGREIRDWKLDIRIVWVKIALGEKEDERRIEIL